MQRLRIKFGRGKELKFIAHLDLMRLWQRTFHRAGIPLAYSEGFVPHPRLALAAPLAVGLTSEAELMDVFCHKVVSPHWLTGALKQQLPSGIEILQINQVSLLMPSLQSLVRFAEYILDVETGKTESELESDLARLLALESLPWQHERDTGVRKYDLRALIDGLWLAGKGDVANLGMRLRCDSTGSGRPEQVALALGFSQRPLRIHRTKLILQAK